MLTELHLENFKAWRELKIELGKITALFGENSSGKSSLLQFLLMLKQTKNAVDRGLVLDFGGGPTELVDLGNYGATVHRDPTTETDLPDMQWSLTWRLPARRRIPFRPNPRERSNRVLADDKVRLTARVGPQAAPELRLAAKRLVYEFGDTTFEIRQRRPRGIPACVIGRGASRNTPAPPQISRAPDSQVPAERGSFRTCEDAPVSF